MKLSLLSLIGLSAHATSAHYIFSKFSVNGAVSADYEYIRKNSNGYQPNLASTGSLDSNDFRCNIGSLDSASTTKVYTVKPGDELGFGLGFGASMQHPGPLQVYLSKAPGDVKTYDGSGSWFKVFQMGLCADITDGLKDTDWCTWGKDTISFTLPKSTPPGEYLVRVEHIALHRGFSGNTELYFECAQIKVTGSGTGTPSPLVKIPGVYKATDPNIAYNIYVGATNYTLPGPAVWNGAGGNVALSSSGIASTSGSMVGPKTSSTLQFSTVRPTTLVTSIKPATTTSVKPVVTSPAKSNAMTSIRPTRTAKPSCGDD